MEIVTNIKYFLPLLILLLIDGVVITFDIQNYYHPAVGKELYNANADGNHAGQWSQFKWVLMMMTCVMLSLLKRNKKYFAWVAVLLFFLLEEMWQPHKVLGSFFYHTFQMVSGTRGRYIMECFAAVFLGFIFSAAVMQAYKTGDKTFRQFSKTFFTLLIIFLLCAVGVHQFVWWTATTHIALRTLQIGGAAIVQSVLTGWCIKTTLKQAQKFNH